MVRTLSLVVFEVSGVEIHAPGLGRAGDPQVMNGKDVADFFKADGTGIFLPVRQVGVQMECQRMEDHRGEHHGLEVRESGLRAFVRGSFGRSAGQFGTGCDAPPCNCPRRPDAAWSAWGEGRPRGKPRRRSPSFGEWPGGPWLGRRRSIEIGRERFKEVSPW